MPTKRPVLDLLTRSELQALVERYDLTVEDRRVREQLVEAVAASRKVSLPEVLADFSRDRLKALCRELGLDDGGREKAALVERLTGTAAAGAATETGAPPPGASRAANGTARSMSQPEQLAFTRG
jgi:type I restriction enzyme M protein